MHQNIWKNTVIICGVILLILATTLFGYSINNDKEKTGEYASNCTYTLSAGIFSINAGCIKQKELPQLSLVDIINEVWDQIDGFSGYYQPSTTSFNYYGATPIFKTEGSPYLRGDKESDLLISEAVKARKKINFTYNELAQYYAEHLSYFVADKDLTNLGRCTRINYILALEGMDGVILNPGDVFNANQKLSSLNGYCRGITDDSFSFYGGVCGMVSQLFRISLLNPDILINSRFPHNERFVQYYGETVGGDDAAVYEYSKQFEIQNIGDGDIVIKTLHKDNWSMMVAISRPTDKYVNIYKENIDGREMAIRLTKNVYNKDDNQNPIRREVFDSYYSRKSYETM